MFKRIKKFFSKSTRGYAAAAVNRFTSDWVTSSTPANYDIYRDMVAVRNRARDLAINNEYVKRYLNLLKQNVIGTGFTVQSGVKNNGVPDTDINRQIENAWYEWTAADNCNVTGVQTLTEMLNVVMESLARDGEILVRRVRNTSKYRYQIQLIESDVLDEKYNTTLKNGNRVVMGVELSEWNKPIAYWLRQTVQDVSSTGIYETTRIRVPASEIIHLYRAERVGQTRGVSWLAPIVARLRQLAGFEEANVTNARAAACKMGFFTRGETGTGYTGNSQDAAGNFIVDVQPGTFEVLPPGVNFIPYDPKFPSDNTADFIKSNLKAFAAGLNVGYVSISQSLEEVNYSSIRAGLLDERDYYKTLQNYLIENLLTPIWREWIESAVLAGVLRISVSRIDAAAGSVTFYGRRWEWVDPYKEAAAAELAIKNNLKSLQQFHAENGLDTYETLEQIAEVKYLTEKLGLNNDTERTKTNAPGSYNGYDTDGERGTRYNIIG